MVSTSTMITKLAGCVGTSDLSDWEEGFVESLKTRLDAGEVTRLTEKQVDRLDELYTKHFA
jgi:hypothetical protein